MPTAHADCSTYTRTDPTKPSTKGTTDSSNNDLIQAKNGVHGTTLET